MRITCEGFRTDYLVKLHLDANSAWVLRWFLSFIGSGNQEYIDVKDNLYDDKLHRYYWIEYDKASKDLPLLYIKNKTAIGNYFRRLCGQGKNNEEEFPLIKYNKWDSHRNKVYFRFRPEVLEMMEGTKKMNSIIDGKPIEKLAKVKTKTNKFQKSSVNQAVLNIFRKAVAFEVDGKKLFPHGLPLDKNHYTSIYSNFQDKIFALYEGRFLTRYQIDTMKDWFKTTYKEYLLKDQIIEKIHACKGSWINTEKLILTSIKNYILWFDPEVQVYDKHKLPRNINEYLYNPFNGISMFYITILMGPAYQREVTAEKIFNSIDKDIRLIFLPYYKDSMDQFTFWNKVKSMIKWYDNYAMDLMEQDSNCQYWLDCGVTEFLQKYMEWLVSWAPKVNLANLGTKNATWSKWLEYAEHAHEIKFTLPRY